MYFSYLLCPATWICPTRWCGNVVQIIVRIEAVVLAGDVDVVDVQQDAAVGLLDDFAEKFPLAHFRDMKFGVAADVFDDDGHFQKILHFADVAWAVFLAAAKV